MYAYWVLITSYSIRIWSLYFVLLSHEIYHIVVVIILHDLWLLDCAWVMCKHISILFRISFIAHHIWEVVISVWLVHVPAAIHFHSGLVPVQDVHSTSLVMLICDGGGQLLECLELEVQHRQTRDIAIVEAAYSAIGWCLALVNLMVFPLILKSILWFECCFLIQLIGLLCYSWWVTSQAQPRFISWILLGGRLSSLEKVGKIGSVPFLRILLCLEVVCSVS